MPTVNPPNPLDAVCNSVANFRKNPLLIMYYPAQGMIAEPDIEDVYGELRTGTCTKEKPLASLDLLLHTYGGDPVAAYRVAQLIRTMTKKLTVLIPSPCV